MSDTMPSGPIDRYLRHAIADDALSCGKMAFVSGPRQVGKTTLALALLDNEKNYYLWDDAKFRVAWSRAPSAAVSLRAPGPILLDEIHKDRRWKTRLKGLHDLHGRSLPIVVTGSARLDLYRRSGDSLLGRFLPYRLHPFSVAERASPISPDGVLAATKPVYPLEALLSLSGFPEPLLAGSEAKARRWSRLRIERLVMEDLRDLRHVHDLQALRVLADLLPGRVGSLLSVNSLREDVGVAYATVRDWIGLFEALYHVILLRPWAGKLSRTLRAEPKLYLFDPLPVADVALRRENLVALHLLKACHTFTDLAMGEFALHFLRTKEKEEIDFVVVREKKPWMLVECKSGDLQPSKTLVKFAGKLGAPHAIQLVSRRGHDREYPQLGVRVMDTERFLAGWV